MDCGIDRKTNKCSCYQKYNIGIITNVSLEVEFIEILGNCFQKQKIDTNIQVFQIDEYQERSEEISHCNLIVVIIDFFTLFQRRYMHFGNAVDTYNNIDAFFEECQYIYDWLKSIFCYQIIWFGFEDYSVKERYLFGASYDIESSIDKLNNKMQEFLKEDIFVDMKYLVSRVGIENSYNETRRIRWNIPYSKCLQKCIAEEIVKQYKILNRQTPKCLILDCDGVLWNGILAEDGIEGIQIGDYGKGRYYLEFQKFLLTMFYHGVILVVCSKNNIQDVLDVFDNHSGMVINRKNIAYFAVNWNDKSENIKKISDYLNIDYNSMVFIDDTPSEIDTVKKNIPEINTILFDKKGVYKQLSCFNLSPKMDLNQIEVRTRCYQTNISREKIKVDCESPKSYRERLETKIDIHEADITEFSRIVELINRTNKCSNGIRCSLAGLKELCRSSAFKLYSIYVSDKFSDLGLVGTLGINQMSIEIFSLSCRALGREVECDMVNMILKKGVKEYRFVDTGKNTDLQRLFKENLLQLVDL